MKKKLTAIILMAMLILTMIPMTAFAAEGDETIANLGVSNICTDLSTDAGVSFGAEIDPEMEDAAYISDEIWTDTETGDTISLQGPDAIAESGHAYSYELVVGAFDGYVFSENMEISYNGETCTPDIRIDDDGKFATISGIIENVTLEEADVNPVVPISVQYDVDNEIKDRLSVEPVIEDYWFEDEGISKDELTDEELTDFAWRNSVPGGYDAENITVKVTKHNITEDESNNIKTKARTTNGYWNVNKITDAYDVDIFVDGEKAEGVYGSFTFAVGGCALGNEADSYIPFSLNGGSASSRDSYDLTGNTLSWTEWDSNSFGFAIAHVSPVNVCTIPVDRVIINNAKLKFKGGDTVVFTGTPGEDIYDFNEDWNESWEGSDYSYALSADYYTSRDDYEGISAFNYGTTYNYSVGVTMTDDAYLAGCYFTDDTKLILNGNEIDADAWVSGDFGDGKNITFMDAARFTTDPVKESTTVTNPSTIATEGTIVTKQNIVKKKANTMTAKAKTIKIKYSKTKKQTIKAKKAFKVSRAVGRVSYKKTKGNKKISVSKSGKITIKKGLKKGTYKVRVKVTAAGNSAYKAKTKTVTLKVKVR